MTQPAYRIDGESATAESFYALACDPQRSVAVEACAGAGKTWMLVSRILRALLEGCAPQDILAITFTKKAAGEMRGRLQAWLQAFASMSDAQLVQELQFRGMNASQAAQHCNQLRELPARLTELGRPVQIRTFHSWFAALLRGAPLAVLQELGLPAQYELLEDDAEAVALAMPRFYAAVAGQPALRQDFWDGVAEHGRSQTVKALEKALQKRVEFALADARGVVDASVEPFGVLHPNWQTLGAPEDALLPDGARKKWLAWAKALGAETNKTPQKAGAAVVDAFALADSPEVMTQRLSMLRKALFVADEDRLTNHLTKFPAAQEAEAELKDLCAAVRQHTAWQHHQRLVRLTRVLVAEYAALKRERGWVDMNDVEGAAQRLLGDAELSGWLQQRLDARVRHLLIDEFQDTNPLQWQALYGWLAAYAGAGSGEAPCVFLVGDPKQSIYRFRRAEPQVFKAAQSFVVQGLGGVLLSCDHTRRCATGVVDALNTVMQAAQDDALYSGYRPHTTASAEVGDLLVLPQIARDPKAEAEADDAPVWRDSLSTPRISPEDTYSAIEAKQAADWIAGELAQGQLKPEHIMVLARKRERLSWLFEALSERGIACEQPEKQDLGEAPAVQDVVALLDALVSTPHDLSLARALKSPLCGVGDAGLAHMARLRRLWTPEPDVQGTSAPAPSWWDVLQRWRALPPGQRPMPMVGDEPDRPDEALAEALDDAATSLARYRDLVHTLPPHDALAAIYQQGDVLARFAQAVPPQQRTAVLAQLRALLAHSLQLEGGRYLTPYRLVRALKAGGIRAPEPPQPQAVRLLTIHGAKGLEAHTVLLLDTDAQPPNPESMGVLVDWPGEEPAPLRFVFLASEKQAPACAAHVLALEQQARALEELNALYVALTRAESRIVVSSTEPHQRGSALTWYQRTQPLATQVDAPQSAAPLPSASTGETFELLELPLADVVPDAEPVASIDATLDAGIAAIDATLDEQARLGLALHRLLQWRPTPGNGFDWTDTHAQAVAREFGLSSRQAGEAVRTAQTMVQGDAAWAWDGQLLNHWGNEVELWHRGQLLRLDRLVRRKDTGDWWVLDFKSALRPERQTELLAKMQQYHAAVRAAQPGDPVRLAFINPLGQVIELAAELPSP